MMKTLLLEADGNSVEQAASLLAKGQVVGIPTETVYGLAANAFDGEAVRRIFTAKGRPQDNPLIVHIASMDDLPKVASNIPSAAYKLAKAFWPGPLTLVLPCAAGIAPEVTCNKPTVGVRMPSHPVAQQILQSCKLPLAAPSANVSGSPSPTTAQHVYKDMQGKIPLIVDGGVSLVGVESTVLTLVGEPTVLRPGFVTREQIEAVLGQKVALSNAIVRPLKLGEEPQSPGMKYRHYAPKAKVTLVRGSAEKYAEFLKKLSQKDGVLALCFEEEENNLPVQALSYGRADNANEQAAALFSTLRHVDEVGAKIVYVHAPSPSGVGLAVYNRLIRAAAFRVVAV